MNPQTSRRRFLAGLLATCSALTFGAAHAEETTPPQEYYEIRIYRCPTAEKQQAVVNYVESALLPALNRQKIDRVGIFTPTGENADHSVFVLIPYRTLDLLGSLNAALAADSAYQAAAADYFKMDPKDPAYTRIESRLMKAFSGIPVLEQPAYSKEKKPRLFELRTYESANAHKAQLKVEMFNKGEIDIMREVQLGPVFFGETLISNDVPNLTYMLSAENEEDHQTHWKGFGPHPQWQILKKMDRYKDTVSKIISTKLVPTAGSQL
ncbi:MAG: NIPSNAP family protein [Rhodopirellula sp.]|nr:NIPSNAP family protein [Rhodopirellula sp.]